MADKDSFIDNVTEVHNKEQVNRCKDIIDNERGCRGAYVSYSLKGAECDVLLAKCSKGLDIALISYNDGTYVRFSSNIGKDLTAIAGNIENPGNDRREISIQMNRAGVFSIKAISESIKNNSPEFAKMFDKYVPKEFTEIAEELDIYEVMSEPDKSSKNDMGLALSSFERDLF